MRTTYRIARRRLYALAAVLLLAAALLAASLREDKQELPCEGAVFATCLGEVATLCA